MFQKCFHSTSFPWRALGSSAWISRPMSLRTLTGTFLICGLSHNSLEPTAAISSRQDTMKARRIALSRAVSSSTQHGGADSRVSKRRSVLLRGKPLDGSAIVSLCQTRRRASYEDPT